MNQNSAVQNVEIYLDYATIPTLNYFLHFAENKDDMETIRLFGLARFHIPEAIINAYPEGKIRYISTKNNAQQAFNQAFAKLLNETTSNLNLNFHLNLFHSFDMFIPLLNLMMEYGHHIQKIKLNFYDDGAEGLTTLYHLNHSTENLAEEISYHKDQLAHLLERKNLTVRNSTVLRYLWGECLPSQYTLLRADYLDQPNLQPLKQALAGHYSTMSFHAFLQFPEEKKLFLLQLLNLPANTKQILSELSLNKKVFIFTGTTIFNGDTQFLADLHLKALNRYLTPNDPNYIGEGYKVFYKGHPNSTELNSLVAKTFPQVISLVESIPLEVLFLLGFIPDKVGGFASTSYLFLEKERIQNLIFITEEGCETESYLFQHQYNQSKLMVDLNYLDPSQVIYYRNFYPQ